MLTIYCFVSVLLAVELAIGDQCGVYHFKAPFFPGESCEDIYSKNPESHDRSGYYWITDGPSKVYCGMTYTGPSCEDIYYENPETGEYKGFYRINGTEWTYCNMTAIEASGFIPICAGVGGGWTRIANVDVSAGDNCPVGWRKDTYSEVSFCRRVSDSHATCSSAFFSTNGTSYQRVCGKARGYEKGVPNAFWGYSGGGQTINGHYAEGLLITYGMPRQHIWTYTIGRYERPLNSGVNCPCAVGGGPVAPPFVGTNYYCESGGADTDDFNDYAFDDPLWDGLDCGISIDCCANSTQPWFYRELNETTTSDIEARLCSWYPFHTASALIDQLELYIQQTF